MSIVNQMMILNHQKRYRSISFERSPTNVRQKLTSKLIQNNTHRDMSHTFQNSPIHSTRQDLILNISPLQNKSPQIAKQKYPFNEISNKQIKKQQIKKQQETWERPSLTPKPKQEQNFFDVRSKTPVAVSAGKQSLSMNSNELQFVKCSPFSVSTSTNSQQNINMMVKSPHQSQSGISKNFAQIVPNLKNHFQQRITNTEPSLSSNQILTLSQKNNDNGKFQIGKSIWEKFNLKTSADGFLSDTQHKSISPLRIDADKQTRHNFLQNSFNNSQAQLNKNFKRKFKAEVDQNQIIYKNNVPIIPNVNMRPEERVSQRKKMGYMKAEEKDPLDNYLSFKKFKKTEQRIFVMNANAPEKTNLITEQGREQEFLQNTEYNDNFKNIPKKYYDPKFQFQNSLIDANSIRKSKKPFKTHQGSNQSEAEKVMLYNENKYIVYKQSMKEKARLKEEALQQEFKKQEEEYQLRQQKIQLQQLVRQSSARNPSVKSLIKLKETNNKSIAETERQLNQQSSANNLTLNSLQQQSHSQLRQRDQNSRHEADFDANDGSRALLNKKKVIGHKGERPSYCKNLFDQA